MLPIFAVSPDTTTDYVKILSSILSHLELSDLLELYQNSIPSTRAAISAALCSQDLWYKKMLLKLPNLTSRQNQINWRLAYHSIYETTTDNRYPFYKYKQTFINCNWNNSFFKVQDTIQLRLLSKELKVASRTGNLEVINIVLQNPIISPSNSRHYAIRMSCQNGHLDVVECLLQDKEHMLMRRTTLSLEWPA